MADKPHVTKELYVSQLVRTGIWATPQNPVQYAFLEQKPAYLPNEAGWAAFSAAQRAAAERAFAVIAEVVNLTFVQVADNQQQPGPSNPRINFYANSVNLNYSGSMGGYYLEGSNAIHGADIRLNTARIAQRQSNEGWADFTSFVALHEILHGMGLSHPGNYNGQGYNYADHAEFVEDTVQYSVMSYWAAAETGADHTIGNVLYGARTPLLYDIAALQSLYAPNMSTRAGDTVYGFNSNTGANSPFNFAVTTGPVVAIWDGGGTDTIDLSGYSSASLINLNAGEFSDAGGLTKNIAIAFGVTIENAIGGAGDDTIRGNEVANSLQGGAGNDLLEGRDGADLLFGGLGADKMEGGLGNDRYYVDQQGDVVAEAAGSGTDTVVATLSYILPDNVENLTLEGSGNLTGNALANVLVGSASANILDGGVGADSMSGGLGDDVYIVDHAVDVVSEAGGDGNDTVQSAISYTLVTAVERLILTGSAAIDGTGNALANRIDGNGAANRIAGGAGGDELLGGAGADVFVYLAFADSTAAAFDQILDFQSGTDRIDLTAVSPSHVGWTDQGAYKHVSVTTAAGIMSFRVYGQLAATDFELGSNTVGTPGDDKLVGTEGDDVIQAQHGGTDSVAAKGGSDSVYFGAAWTSADQVDGGGGDDRVVLQGSYAGGSFGTGNLVSVERLTLLSASNNAFGGASGGAHNYAIAFSDAAVAGAAFTVDASGLGAAERLVFDGSAETAASLTVTGGAGADDLKGGAGNDALAGGAGDDVLTGGSGADQMAGGTGNDVYHAENGDSIFENGGEGTDTVEASVSFTLGANLEALILSGSDIAGTGNALANSITGSGGKQTLDGGAGADVLAGGEDGDDYHVDDAGDQVVEADGHSGQDRVFSAISYTLAANVEELILVGSAVSGTGNALANAISGNSGDNILDGGLGADTLGGGLGNDTYIVDSGDVVVEAAGSGTDTIHASGHAVLGANIETLVLTGSANSNGTGNELANSITGNGGANILRGGGGADLLTGGGGADVFGYLAASDSTGEAYDTILDFQSGIDKLDLRALNATSVTLTDHGSYREVLAHTAGGPFSVRVSGQIAMADIDLGAPPAGTPGDDGIVGTERDDTIRAEQGGNDFVAGNGGNDIVYFGTAFTAADQIDGGAGDDQLVVRGAYPTLVLGGGNLVNVERLVLLSSANSVYEPAAAGPFSYNITLFDPAVTAASLILDASGLGSNEVLIFNGSQESAAALLVTGGGGADSMTGGFGADSLFGGEGADSLTGGAGEDSLFGEAGNDSLDGGLGADTLTGGLGNDTYIVDHAGDITSEFQGSGDDLVISSVSYTLDSSGIERLTLAGTQNINGTGNRENNVLTGNAGDNILNGKEGADTLIGGGGRDVYILDQAGDLVVEQADGGFDEVEVHFDYTLPDHIESGTQTGTGTLTGNALRNHLSGGAAVLDGGAGADYLTGGSGNTTFIVDDPGDSVSEWRSTDSADVVRSSISYTLPDQVEQLVLTGSAIMATGNGLRNVIIGNDEANVIVGGHWEDVLTGGGGADTFLYRNMAELGDTLTDFQSGVDKIDLFALGAIGVSWTQVGSYQEVEVRKGFATLNLKVSGTLAMSDFIIASNTLGTTADDVLTGDLEDNYIQMEHGGDDSAAGSGGDDLFYFGAAWTPGDRVDGGDGRDTVLLQGRYPLAVFGAGNLDSVEELRLIRSTLSNYGGQGGGPNDYTIVFTDAAAVGSYFSVDGTWLSAGERLVFDGSAETATPLTVQGGDGADDLKGGGAVDSLIGGPGADILDGGGGGDYLKGGHGDDIYIVDGGDIVTEAAGSGTDTIQASGDAVLGANVENLVLTGSADSNGTGNDLANSITGNGGANILRGGGGADLLTGGGGADIFRYGAASDSTAAAYDTILDFQSGIDKLDLSALNPTGVTLTDHGSYREVLAQTAGGPFSVRISGQIAMADIDLGTPPAGTPGDDSIVGTEREDIIRVEQGGIDFVGGNGGNDVFYFGAAFTAADQVDGGAGDDRLIVRGSYPNLVLGSGNLTNVERLVLLSSGNSAYEPAAAGPFSYAVTLFDPAVTAVSLVVDASGLGANEILTFNGAQESGAALLVTGGAGGDALTGGLGNDSLNGGAGDDNLAGGAGIDQLEGGAGNDRLDGGVGADAQAGGAGDDVYVIDNAGDSVTELAGGGSDTVESLLSHTLGAEIENLVLLGTALSGTGNGLANRITGNGANNVLDGMAGADITTGGTGDDLYRVDDAGDSVVEASGAGTDSVEAAVTHTLGAHVENLTLIGSTAIDGSGNDLANIILGNDAANVLAGHGGNDVLNGGAGADVMSGGTGDDVYVVDQEGDSVSEAGGGGVDRVQSAVAWVLADGFEVLTLTGSAAIAGTGNAADNSLYGNGAANFLNGAGGADQMYGGNGDDIYIVDHLNDRANETSAGGGTDEVQSSVSFQLEANVENLTLTGTGDTTGVGNALANVLIGNTGNNTLSGAAGADTMSGGLGHDVYWVDDAGDVVNEAESAGIDRAESAISYTLGLHVDNLTLTGTAANGTGNGLANVIIGNASANTLSGGDGDDTLDGKAGADTMIGGYGYDIYFVDDAGDVVSETFTGDLDTVQSLISYTLGANLDILTLAGTGHINGTGNLLGNVLNGNAGHNVLDGGGGADNMFGGLGNDTYIISDLGDKAFETSSVGGNDHVLSAISFQLGSNIEKLTLTGTGNTNGFGNENSNTLIGNGGNNTLSGGAGADTMTGGAGHDIYYVDVAGDVVNEAAAEGTDTVNSAITYTLGANLENLTLTGSAALNGTGNELNNVITGNAGANSLNGGNGNDTLTGGLGADTLNGGSGDDTYVIDGSDTLVEFAGGGNDTVQTSQSYTLLAEFEYLTLTGSLNVNGTGNAANNVLNGNAGNNTLDGGAGADNMFGGLGNDTYVVDNVLDRASENSALGGTDTVMSSVSFTLGANVENLTLTASGNVSGIGNDLANVINGNAGDNLISGGLGADALSGGAGNDSFLYGAAAHSTAAARDTILSFASGDKINLAQIDANATTTGTNDAFTFIGSGAFSNVAGQLRAYKSGTEWIVEGDTNGDGTADLVIGLTTVNPAIVAADFVL